jgi:hypothetical protein
MENGHLQVGGCAAHDLATQLYCIAVMGGRTDVETFDTFGEAWSTR